ncbi:corrinoid protein [Candidatus Bathyarchaeota archaeon]|nr:corrinoid protein [Candidatus Bathyarchaeota archaeon]
MGALGLTGVLDDIADALANLNSKDLRRLIQEALDEGIPPIRILEDGLRRGLEEVGRRFEAGEYFLSELLYGADLMSDSMGLLASRLNFEGSDGRGVIVLGTVRGDIHDIGKNIFKMFAEGCGFKVYDLGVDVDPERFIEAVSERSPDVLGLSALLTTVLPEVELVVKRLKEKGLRNKVKILLGGNAVTEEFGRRIGVDGVAVDAVQGVKFCREWMTDGGA